MGYKEFEDFQSLVDSHLLRHRSLLDIMTKYQESASRVNRALAKAVTSCGCVEIHAKKQEIPDDVSLSGLKAYMDSHLRGELCDQCRDVIEKELGNQLFFMASLANLLGIRLDEVLEKEEKKMDTLGVYGLR
ncbi:MAG TPA: DUF1573 domain-containing protein [Candidatus Atribacteria bacterium]|nr:DUF1573 domain-containing protein [Candidatus Atribacteria bacterium]HPT78408.1 DUF1573 domain-containing protein [Candidatus Atribacteria bacterium]